MKKNKFVSLLTVLFVGLFISSCTTLSGTYEWEKDGFHYSVTINGNAEQAPCTVRYTNPSGIQETYQTSYHFWRRSFTTPRSQIDIKDVALIDLENLEVYCSGDFFDLVSDFEARRNAVRCIKR